MFRRVSSLLAFCPLAATVDLVTLRKVNLTADDLYQICMVIGAKDPLGLRTNTDFLASLAITHHHLPSGSLPPFQATMVETALKSIELTPEQIASGAPLKNAEAVSESQSPETALREVDDEDPKNITYTDPTIQERMEAIWEAVSLYHTGEYTPSDSQKIQTHCQALDPMIRKLSVAELLSLVQALATVNFYNFEFSTLIARRCCELAPEMSGKQLCRVYHNLMRLNVQDSLIAIVKRVEANVDELHWKDILLFTQALERQQNTTAAPSVLVPKLAHRVVSMLETIPTNAIYRSMLVSMARYNVHRHPAAAALIKAAGNDAVNLSDKDLLPILQALSTMKLFKSEGASALFNRATTVVSVIDIRFIDQLVDIISLCNIDSTPFMNNLMIRLSADAGRLSIPQLVFLIDLVSSYPPIRGSPCAVALAFTANMRKESIDATKIELTTLGLARMAHFTDDFYAVATYMFTHRQGFRTFDSLSEFFGYLNPTVAREQQMVDLVARGVESLAPILNDEELLHCKKVLMSLGINDRRIQQQIFGQVRRVQQTYRGGKGNIKRGYDPADDLL